MEQGSLRLLTNGQTIFDRYRLKMLVGKGAMGVVWRAEDLELNVDIALKFLAEEFLFDAAALADLKRETRRGMALAHPHIVRIFGFHQGGSYAAVAMEYVEGNTLGALQAARRAPFFEVDEIADWVRQLCGALEYAHTEALLVHRDLKPGNLMVDSRGRIKVADFGIAAELNAAHTRVAGTNDTRGTLSYMSPQQLLGQRPCVDHDVYSVGATIYDLLTGRPPFSTGDVSLQVRTVVPPTLAEQRAGNGYDGGPIPAHWEETIAACLSKDASQRPASAALLAQRLGLEPVGYGSRSPMGPGQIPVPRNTGAIEVAAAALPGSHGGRGTAGSRGTAGHRAAPAGATALQTVPAPTVVAAGSRPPSGAIEVSTVVPVPQKVFWIIGGAAACLLVAVIAGMGVYFGSKLAREPLPPPPKSGPITVHPPSAPSAAPADSKADAKVAPKLNLDPGAATTAVLASKEKEAAARSGAVPAGAPSPEGGAKKGKRKGPPPFGTAPAFASFEPRPPSERPEPERPLTLPGLALELVWVPRGNNAVGVPSHAPEVPENEFPVTDVFLSEGFWLGKHEVSRGQFTNVMGFNPSLFHLGADYPVSNVSWVEAMEFCRRLTERERKAGRLTGEFEYTLPTEAQWEYAAKSGFVGRYGVHESLEKAAWMKNANVDRPQPRGKLEPNGWGLHDMFGNVAEWCRDWYVSGRPGGRVDDYTGPATGTQRVYKGGSFADSEFMLRASVRAGLAPAERDPQIGFRLALVRRAKDK